MLRRKLVRDLWRLRYQVLTIGLLVGCGIGAFVAAVTASTSLQASRNAFYADARFANIFAHLDRAPHLLLDRLRELPGVSVVEGRIVEDVRLEMDFSTEPVTARFVSLSWPASDQLNQLQIRAGRPIDPSHRDEIVLSDAFAEAWDLHPGAAMTAIIDGHRVRMTVVGIGISPEFVYPPSPTGLADPRHFGVAWMDGDALAKATGRAGAFNDVVMQTAAGADLRDVMDRVDTLLAPYGGLGAVSRDDQPSAKLVDQKIGQLTKMATLLPVIFLGVAAFLLNVLISRIVGTQREQIATLKAVGFRTRELAWHYVTLAATICALGAVFGVTFGLLGAKQLLLMYGYYFRFPSLALQFNISTVIIGTLVASAAALTGVIFAVTKAVAVPPAVAMQPEAPPTFRATWLDHIYALFAPATRMVLRDIQRRPLRLLLSAGSITLATAILVVGRCTVDSLEAMLRIEYEVAHREDIDVTLDQTRPWRAVRDIAHIPGVMKAEGERVVPVRLRVGQRTRTAVIFGLRPGAELHRVLDIHERPLLLPSGLSLSCPLGEELGVQPGDNVDVEVLEAGRPTARVPVAALVDDLIGVSGYMESSQLDRLFNEAPAANVVLLSVEHSDLDGVTQRLDALPAVAAISRPATDRSLLEKEIVDELFGLQVMLAFFAVTIAGGVVYNNARIALEVRSRDLATLRILGFTRGELAVVLLGEQGVQLLLGVAPGVWLGRWAGALTLSTINRDLIRIPFTLSPASQIAAVCVVLFAALVSALMVRRRSDRLDLVAVLKAQD